MSIGRSIGTGVRWAAWALLPFVAGLFLVAFTAMVAASRGSASFLPVLLVSPIVLETAPAIVAITVGWTLVAQWMPSLERRTAIAYLATLGFALAVLTVTQPLRSGAWRLQSMFPGVAVLTTGLAILAPRVFVSSLRPGRLHPIGSHHRPVSLPGGWIPRFVTLLLLTLQAGTVIFAAYLWAIGDVAGDWLLPGVVFVMSIILFPILGVAGITWAIVSEVKGREPRIVAVPLFLVSLAMCSVIVPLWAIKGVGSRLRPIASARAAQAAHRASETYAALKRAHYDSLLERFRMPRRVLNARPKYLRLDDYSVITMLDFEGSKTMNERFEAWAAENLVGHEVRIVLPDRKLFEDHYVPGSSTGLLGVRLRDPGTGTSYGNVPAFVLLDGDLMNKRFTDNPDLKEKFFREHAAPVR